MKNAKRWVIMVVGLALVVCGAKVSEGGAMGTAFTYQGHLYDANYPANGLYDLQFALYDGNDPCTGSQVGSDVNKPDVDVIDGYFTVALDFNDANAFNGDARWLEIGVRPGEMNDPNGYTPLSPLQEVTAAPYALRAKSVSAPLELVASTPGGTAVLGVMNTGDGVAIGAQGKNGDIGMLGMSGVAVAGIAGSGGLAGSFDGNIDVNGSAFVDGNVGIGTTNPSEVLDVNGNINSSGSYKLDGTTVLSNAGPNNIFAGEGAGASITTGNHNSAMGYQALYANTTGYWNSAMGVYALLSNTAGGFNTAVGGSALYFNTTGWYNSAMGSQALLSNTTGSNNSAMGYQALLSNTTGSKNSAMGNEALWYNTTGVENSAVGYRALLFNTTGMHNSAMGYRAGYSSTGSGNVFLGYRAGYSETGDNKLYIANGSADANVLIYGDFNTGRVGIGTTDPNGTLDVNGPIYQRGGSLHADYVFEDGYELESIDEHSEIMWGERHLPAIPKAKVDGNGQEVVEVGAHRKGIVEELEKAHIYIEQLHEENIEIKKQLAEIKQVLSKLALQQKGRL